MNKSDAAAGSFPVFGGYIPDSCKNQKDEQREKRTMLLRDIINHRGGSAFSSSQKAQTSPPPVVKVGLKRHSVSPFSCTYQNKQFETFSKTIEETVKNIKSLESQSNHKGEINIVRCTTKIPLKGNTLKRNSEGRRRFSPLG